MDLAAVTKLVSGEGWGLLQSLPPYDESTALSLGEGLRQAGFDADMVAAALTQSRGSEEPGSSRCSTSAVASVPTRWRSPGWT